MTGSDRVRAWQPRVAGVAEVLHGEWREHTYPAHRHDTWTPLIVDDGLIGYELAAHERAAPRSGVTLLPPNVVHDGPPDDVSRFRKRVMYLDEQVLEAESPLAVVVELLSRRLWGGAAPRPLPAPGQVASSARETFDADPVGMRSVADVAAALGVSTAHLVRARSYGIPPHPYILGRRLDLARRRLLAGDDVAQAAFATGFYDQAYLARHFRRLLSTTPGHYQSTRTT